MSNFKVKLLPRSTLKGKIATTFPASVVGASPIEITQNGMSYTIGIDLDALMSSIFVTDAEFADAGQDRLWGWDEDTNTYKNFALTDMFTEPTPSSGDFLLMYGAEGDLRKVNWSSLPGAAGATQAFGTIQVSGQSDVVADAAPDILTLIAGSNIVLTTNAGTDSITAALASSISVTDIAVSNETRPTRVTDKVVTLTDGASVSLDASLGNTFKLLAAGNRTILAPSNPPVTGRSQRIIIAHEASGADRTLSLTTGAGGFRFGTDITGLSPTLNGTIDYFAAVWNEADNRWDVVSLVRGF